jgi:hypothetical protein
VDQPSVHVFETIRFLSDAFDQVDLDVSPLQKPSGLPVAQASLCTRTFCLRVKFVLSDNISMRFDPGASNLLLWDIADAWEAIELMFLKRER